MIKWPKNCLKTSNLFVGWLFSYISLLLIPVIISGIIYIKSESIVQQEIQNSNEAMLNQLRLTIDSRMKSIEQTAVQIALNPKIKTVMSVKGAFGPENQFSLYELQKELMAHKTANGFVDDIYIYFRNNKSILSTGNFSSAVTFYTLSYKKSSLLLEEWLEYMQNPGVMNYTVIKQNFEAENEKKLIFYSLLLPIINIDDIEATLFVVINESKLKEIISTTVKVSDSSILILDGSDEEITRVHSDKLPQLDYRSIKKDNTVYSITPENDDFIISNIPSRVTEWEYITITPSKLFWQKVEYIKKLTFAGLFACLFLGGLVAYLFSRRNYFPIKDIIEDLTKRTNLPLNRGRNEYNIIKEAINSTIDERNEINQKLEQQKRILRNNCLMRLLKGDFDTSASIRELLEGHDIVFSGKECAVLIFYIDHFKDFIPEELDCNSNNKMDLVKLVILKFTCEAMNQKFRSYSLEADGMLTCIIDMEATGDATGTKTEELMAIIEQARKLIADRFKIYFTVSISNMHHEVSDISQAYREALEAMEHKVVLEGVPIIRYEDIRKPSQYYNYSVITEQKLANLIKAGNFQNARELLEQILSDNFSLEFFSVEMGRYLIYDIAGTVIKVLDSISGGFIEENHEHIRSLLEQKTLIEMKKQITALLERVCDYADKKNKGSAKDDAFVNNIRHYVTDHYKDMNLSISMIGDAFKTTPAYLSKLFKEKSDQRLLDYINTVRIEEAKILLEQSTLSIQEISEKVGFLSSPAFIRTFKKYTGLTPGKYKEI